MKFINETSPSKVEKLDNGKLRVHYSQGGMSIFGDYDTVMLAVGRKIITDQLNLQNAGIE
jgi:pyruvate/2-oxoglutarate dehydrogenase complex dihydrolipoamide dehydrogenase (E3) component